MPPNRHPLPPNPAHPDGRGWVGVGHSNSLMKLTAKRAFASSSANCIFVVIDDALGFALQAKRHARGRLDLALASLVRSAGYWPK